MTGADDDIVVTIEEEPEEIETGAEAGKTAKPGEEGKTGEKAKTGEEGIEDLLKRLKEVETREQNEKLARRDAERRAADSDATAKKVSEELEGTKAAKDDAEYNAVENALAAVQAEGDAAAKELEAAFEAGDAKKIVEAQRKVARSEARAVELEGGKAALDARRKTAAEREEPGDRREPRRTDAREERRAADTGDPVEQYINQFHPRSQDWLRRHRECVTDDKLNKKVLAAHNLAESEGIKANTDEYFDYIDEFMGFKEKKEPGATAERRPPANQQQQQRRSAPSAPVSRDNGGGSGSELQPGEVKLTPREAKAATDGTLVWNTGPEKGKPIGTKEFARRKLAMTRDGYYDPANYGHQ